MKWTTSLVGYWCEHYYELRNYELLPFERQYISGALVFLGGSSPSLSPYEETCDLNWEFDKALKKLSNENEFRRLYLDGGGENPALFNELVKLLEA